MSVQGGAGFHVTATGVIDSAGGGTLHTVTVNKGAASATVTLYDGKSASGALIAVIDASVPQTLTYDITLNSGLYAVVSGSIDVTVSVLPAERFNT